MLKISVIGAGHGGLALAAHFAAYGEVVTLCASKQHMGFSQNIVGNKNRITINNHVDGTSSTTTIHAVTHDYKVAMANSEIIFIVTPSFAHEAVLCIPV